MLKEILKRRYDKAVCTLFKQDSVTLGDALKRLGSIIFYLLGVYVILCMCGVLAFFVCGAISVSATVQFLDSLSLAGLLIFAPLFGIIFICTFLLTRIMFLKAISVIKFIANIKIAEKRVK